MKILITSNSFGKFDETPRKKMLDLGWNLISNRYHKILGEKEMMQEVQDIDGIILGSDTVNRNVLNCANKLKIISRYGVGIDNIDLEECKNRDIKVTVTKNCNTEAVADYTIGLMLNVLRHICNVNNSLNAGEWRKETGLDLCHKKIGVIGLGSIGRQVIKRLKGFDCKILGYDLYIDQEYCESNNIEIMTPEEIYKNADIITLHTPGNSDGSPMIGQHELEMMNEYTVLINTARASLVDEEALICALKSKKIYGYGTDVFVGEPEINKGFKGLDNVVLSPHNAAVSKEAVNKMSNLAVDNLIDFFEGGN